MTMTHARPPLIEILPLDLIERYARLWRQQAEAEMLTDEARRFSQMQASAYEAELERRERCEPVTAQNA